LVEDLEMRSDEEDQFLLARNPGGAVGAAVKVAGNFGKDLAHTVLTNMAVDKFKKKMTPHREPHPAINNAVDMMTKPHDPKLVK
jgi:hypothetical protein